jgi:TonB family protein
MRSLTLIIVSLLLTLPTWAQDCERSYDEFDQADRISCDWAWVDYLDCCTSLEPRARAFWSEESDEYVLILAIPSEIGGAMDAAFDNSAELIVDEWRGVWDADGDYEQGHILVTMDLSNTLQNDVKDMPRRIARADTLKVRIGGVPLDISPVTGQMARVMEMTTDFQPSRDDTIRAVRHEAQLKNQRSGPEEEEGEVFMVVDKQPELVGGMEALQQSVEYPGFAKQAGIEGRVIVQFIVDEEGNVQDPKITRGVHKLLNEEAIRAVKEQKFKPGKKRGRAVKVQMSLPVDFRP